MTERTEMNLIQKLNACIANPDHRTLAIRTFPDRSLGVYIYESEVPISVDLDTREVYLDIEGWLGCDRLDSGCLIELGKLCQCLEENLDVLDSWFVR